LLTRTVPKTNDTYEKKGIEEKPLIYSILPYVIVSPLTLSVFFLPSPGLESSSLGALGDGRSPLPGSLQARHPTDGRGLVSPPIDPIGRGVSKRNQKRVGSERISRVPVNLAEDVI
jgi:hypothetical protein